MSQEQFSSLISTQNDIFLRHLDCSSAKYASKYEVCSY